MNILNQEYFRPLSATRKCEIPGALRPAPPPGLCSGPTGGLTAPARPPVGISNDHWSLQIMPSARYPYPANNFTLASPISLYPAQKLDNPPNRRTSHQKPAEKSSTGGCVTQGCEIRQMIKFVIKLLPHALRLVFIKRA